ncbi:hypothetical protein AB0230_01690 [Microbacterium sp. NPDC089190]|uniref:hypothetical protein n=1 Tax=Microbacterium sp. NPDC089190 TaxID=3155063 RepID=UPI00344CF4E5
MDRTYTTLASFKRQVEDELRDLNLERSRMQASCWARGKAGSSDWFKYELEHKEKRAKLGSKSSAITTALALVKPHMKVARQRRADEAYAGLLANQFEASTENGAAMRALIFGLVGAIQEHKESIESSANTPTVSDRALWSSLARMKMPTRDGEVALREWFLRSVQ